MIMRLLALLDKILGEVRRQLRVHPNEELLNDRQLDMLGTITRIYRQLSHIFPIQLIVFYMIGLPVNSDGMN